ncbi:MAG: hypothetical protein WB992_14215 [Bryobacteraceae bacterium]
MARYGTDSGGAFRSKDIEAALNGCEVLMAVLTSGSYVSRICRAEQIRALDEGKVVIPVLAVAGSPVPIHLKSRNYRKYPEQEAELLADVDFTWHLWSGSHAPCATIRRRTCQILM